MTLADRVLELIRSFAPGYDLNYTKHYIGLAQKGQADNFLIFRPQKTALRFEPNLPKNDETTKRLEDAGLEVLEYDRQFGYYKIRLSAEDIDRHREMLTAIAKEAFDLRH